MPATKTLNQILAELRSCANARVRRPVRAIEAVPLIVRLLGECKTVAAEERGNGMAFRLQGATESGIPFAITCMLHHAAGQVVLTTAEHAVAELLCEGHTLAQIARVRGVSANTVKSQVRQVFRKLNVESRVALVRKMGV